MMLTGHHGREDSIEDVEVMEDVEDKEQDEVEDEERNKADDERLMARKVGCVELTQKKKKQSKEEITS